MLSKYEQFLAPEVNSNMLDYFLQFCFFLPSIHQFVCELAAARIKRVAQSGKRNNSTHKRFTKVWLLAEFFFTLDVGLSY